MKNKSKAFIFLALAVVGAIILSLVSCTKRKIEPQESDKTFVRSVYQENGLLVLNVKKSGKKEEIAIELEPTNYGDYFFAFEGVEYKLYYFRGPLGASILIGENAWTVEIRDK